MRGHQTSILEIAFAVAACLALAAVLAAAQFIATSGGLDAVRSLFEAPTMGTVASGGGGRLGSLFRQNLVVVLATAAALFVFYRARIEMPLRRLADVISAETWPTGPEEADGRTRAVRAILGALGVIGARLTAKNAKIDALTRQFDLLLKATSSSVLGVATDRKVLIANPAARSLLNAERDTPFPWPSQVAFMNETEMKPLDAATDPLDRSLRGDALSGEDHLLAGAAGGGLRRVRVSSAPGEGDPIAAVMALDDISEQDANRRRIERASRLESLSQLTSGVAHDFNNLLATIIYALDLSRGSELPDKTLRYLDLALSAAMRGSDLTGRLFTFAKRRPGFPSSKPVGETLANLKALIEPIVDPSITLDASAEDEYLRVYCDHVQLENAVLNLVLNARDAILHSGRGDRIAISARSVGARAMAMDAGADGAGVDKAPGVTAYRQVEIAVSDNGPGMNADIRRRALDPAFAASAVAGGGAADGGQGLSVVSGFVEQANGALQIDANEGEGTVVRMLLPRGMDEVHPSDHVSPERRIDGGGRRVLLVEDEPSLLNVMGTLLRSMNFTIVEAKSGDAALLRIEEETHLDLMITDIVMPGEVDGFTLARRARARFASLPIVYMTGGLGFARRDPNAVSGEMVRKPCRPEDLLQAIAAALKQNAETAFA